ncbi:hypothetical protein [Ekhidna sp.]|uniref:hypothetical protein n=1 Tax=Ekhidna sp. TaxID=2608089 RepID=UPI0032975C82
MKVFHLALIMASLSGCKDDNSSVEDNVLLIGLEETVSAGIRGNNWIVTFQSIEENSLCPEDAVCIWQGRLIVSLQINNQVAILGFGDLSTNEGESEVSNSLVINGTNITLIEALETDETITTKIKLQFD